MAVTLNASTSSGLVQTADTSGTVEIQSNGTTRLTVASGGVTTTGNTSIANLTATGTFGGGVITAGTAVASTSGTSIDFTSIPSWAKRITVLFNGVGTNGSSNFLIQIGTGGTPTTSGYISTGSRVWTSVNVQNSTSGFIYGVDNSAMLVSGASTITNLTGNNWICTGIIGQTESAGTFMTMQTGGSVTLGGVLNMVRITTVNGTDTFDAGTINILYEG